MASRTLSSLGLFLLAGAALLETPGSGRAADPGIGHLQHLGYYNPHPYQSHYLYYPFHGGGYPWYDYRPYYGWRFPSDRAERQKEEPAKAPPDTRAHLILRVPSDAELWFNGTKISAEGEVRKFASPPLTPGHRYSYEIRTQWQKNGQTITRTREVSVKAGIHVEVDFTKSDKMDW